MTSSLVSGNYGRDRIGLENSAEEAGAALDQRRKVLDDVNAIAGLRQGDEGLPGRE